MKSKAAVGIVVFVVVAAAVFSARREVVLMSARESESRTTAQIVEVPDGMLFGRKRVLRFLYDQSNWSRDDDSMWLTNLTDIQLAELTMRWNSRFRLDLKTGDQAMIIHFNLVGADPK